MQVYEIVRKFGLPSGLLPDSVADYSFSSDGHFVVHLEKPCYVEFYYLVYYDTTITGKLNYGSIADLNGIQVRRFFLRQWLDVDEIRVDLPPSESIYFQVGFINKKLDIHQFKTIHSCRDSVMGSCLGSLKRVFEITEGLSDCFFYILYSLNRCLLSNNISDLGNSNLSGHLVPELGKLEILKYLELYKNNIQGTIPSELGSLKSLISLDSYNNILSRTIPPSLGKLKGIVFFPIPRELAAISSLKVVDVSDNDLCGTIPTTGPFEHIPLSK
ncbi:hypothetical protein K1719_038585 [Acacia pycnantha]|nr:hypothetical protein K1719_038585 [Acacia pycnantha]